MAWLRWQVSPMPLMYNAAGSSWHPHKDNAEQHPAAQTTAQFWLKEGLQSYSWIHQVIHMHICAKWGSWLPGAKWAQAACPQPCCPQPCQLCPHPSHTPQHKVRCAPGGLFSLQLWLTATKQTITRLPAAVLSIFFFPLTTKRFFTPFVP